MREHAARKIRHIGLVVGAVAALGFVAASPSHAAPPTVANVTNCVGGGGEVQQPPNSPIRACCFDARDFGLEAGCFICDKDWTNCVFEPAVKGRAMTSRPAAPTTSVAPPTTGIPPRTGLPGVQTAPGGMQIR
jgi:hypothetical protein